jgi:alkylated DNA repair dioxygenase AlkB
MSTCCASRTVYLDEGQTCFLKLSKIPEDMKMYATCSFDKLFNMHPIAKSEVICCDKERDAHRWFKSYLNTPKLDIEFLKRSKCNYMFSTFDENVNEPIPEEFVPFLEFMNSQGKSYNQVVINWYENGSDYLPYHSDWEHGKCDDDVSIITLTSACNDMCRTFSLKPNKVGKADAIFKKLDISLTHGLIIAMCGETQKKFWHGIPKESSITARRISISFRSFE